MSGRVQDKHSSCELVRAQSAVMGDAFGLHVAAVLNPEVPWPEHLVLAEDLLHFIVFRYGDLVLIEDGYLSLACQIAVDHLQNSHFDLPGWYTAFTHTYFAPESVCALEEGLALLDGLALDCDTADEGISYPIVVTVQVNGQPARTLLDSGSLADFMSAKFAHQLNIKAYELEKPLPVQLAADIVYQTVQERRYFDIMNILNYDIIFSTPFLTQHCLVQGFNPSKVVVGSANIVPVHASQACIVESRAADVLEGELEHICLVLCDYAAPICRNASDAPFPPLHAVNHTIPLKDPAKVYHWRPSKCLDALRPL
ncbi:hypothetical protein C8Q77DRAFT_1214653 [Trametes polyzona]|nr:hypothetical protein C8Q77DRAFT_1214653 [Trametes polyzona]